MATSYRLTYCSMEALVLCMLILFDPVFAAVLPTKRWKCSSELSGYTNDYCYRKGDIPGCYYSYAFNAYQSCAFVCNGVKRNSNDEERCKSDCPYYLNRDGECILITESSTTSPSTVTQTSPTVMMSPSATVPSSAVTSQTPPLTTETSLPTHVVAGLCSSLALLVVITSGLGVALWKKRRKKNKGSISGQNEGSQQGTSQASLLSASNEEHQDAEETTNTPSTPTSSCSQETTSNHEGSSMIGGDEEEEFQPRPTTQIHEETGYCTQPALPIFGEDEFSEERRCNRDIPIPNFVIPLLNQGDIEPNSSAQREQTTVHFEVTMRH